MIPKLVAHRGYMESYPENSVKGLEMALKAGACMVEFDVQMNADHEFIVLHDSDFKRTANIEDSVFTQKSSDLLDISVHEPERFGDRFLKTPVPTLNQVMKLIAGYPSVTAFVEIKDESLSQWGLEYVMDALHKALETHLAQSVIISFSLKAMQYVKMRGLFSVGWVLSDFDETTHQQAIQLSPEYLICNHKKITGYNEPWLGGWSWMLYDITDAELALQWAKRGAAIIETRDIGTMLQHSELRKEACNHGV